MAPMRWTQDLPPTPTALGDQKTCKAFLWFPKLIGNETRWLEWAVWLEEFQVVEIASEEPHDFTTHINRYERWEPSAWVTQQER